MQNNENKLINTNKDGEKVLFYYYDKENKVFSYYSSKKKESISIKLEDIHLSLQKGGNIKTGPEWLLNTLPGDNPITAKGLPLTNMRGSCIGCCDGCEKFCYAIHGARQHHNSVMPSVIKNLILYREDRERFLKELRAELNGRKSEHKVFRWHASGEIDSPEYLEDMMLIASEYPDIHFYSYTKRFTWIANYLDKHNGKFPENFCWNLSVWKDNLQQAGFPDKYLKEVQLFAWDDLDDPSLKNVVHCPSVSYIEGAKKGHLNHTPLPNGKERNCKNCGLCWKGKMKGKLIAVYNH